MKFYGQIRKAEEQADGTIKVFGIASVGTIDSTGETITAACMKAALPEYMKFGAVREMHQPLAAGTAISADVNAAGELEFSAHIVDPIAVTKVKTGVYKGFSVGGKCRGRDALDKSIITAMDLTEISLVDRPAHPDALINVWKADMTIATETTPSAPVVETIVAVIAPVTEVKKSMYMVSGFASLLSTIGSVARDAEWEMNDEKDNSPIPALLRAWLAEGVEIFQAMAVEETEEMVASLTASATAKAAPTGDIAKAGAKFSKSTKSKLAEAHAALKTASEHLAALGAEDDADEAEKAAPTGDVAKSDVVTDVPVVAVDESIAKAAEAETVAKALIETEIAKALAPVTAELTIAKARVAELEAMPAPAKGVLTVVEKSVSSVVEVTAVMKSDGSVDETATAIKKAFQSGGFRLL